MNKQTESTKPPGGKGYTKGQIRTEGTGHTYVHLTSCDVPITAAIGQRRIATVERDADAARLALCWNAHDQLVEALESLLTHIVDHHSYDCMDSKHILCPVCTNKRGDDFLNKAHAALSLARGESKP